MQMMTTSVIAVTTRRVVQLMPRLTHHNSAQLMKTGAMRSIFNLPRDGSIYREPETPAPMPIPPPIFIQVSVPSTLTKPGP